MSGHQQLQGSKRQFMVWVCTAGKCPPVLDGAFCRCSDERRGIVKYRERVPVEMVPRSVNAHGRVIALEVDDAIDEFGQFRVAVTVNTISGATKEIWSAYLTNKSDEAS